MKQLIICTYKRKKSIFLTAILAYLLPLYSCVMTVQNNIISAIQGDIICTSLWYLFIRETNQESQNIYDHIYSYCTFDI